MEQKLPDHRVYIDVGYFDGPVSQFADQLRTAFKDNPAGLEQLCRLISEQQTMRQSGMEAKHEQWVLATLNFLTGMDIPVWNHDARGTRLPHDKEIPERLQLLKQKFAELAADRNRLSKSYTEKSEENYRVKQQLGVCYDLLSELARTMAASVPQDLKDRLLSAFPEFLGYFATPLESSTPLEARPPDPTGS